MRKRIIRLLCYYVIGVIVIGILDYDRGVLNILKDALLITVVFEVIDIICDKIRRSGRG